MVGTFEIGKRLASFLPKTIEVENGDDIVLTWHDGMEVVAPADNPYGVFTEQGNTGVVQNRTLSPVSVSTNATEGITFVSGTAVYQVINRDVISVTSVTGTLAATPGHLFVEDVDYRLARSPDYWTYDRIEWIDGGDKPDNGTLFTVIYVHQLVNMNRGSERRLAYRLELFVADLASGSKGATVAYAKSRLAQQISDSLEGFLVVNRGKNLAGTGEVTVGEVRNLGPLPIDESETLVRWGIEIELRRFHIALKEQVTTIGSTEIDPTQFIP